MATTFTATHFIQLDGVSPGDTAKELSWNFSQDKAVSGNVEDVDGDGTLDRGVDWAYSASLTFTGYVVTAGGQDFGIFSNGTLYRVPYDKTAYDLSGDFGITNGNVSTVPGTSDGYYEQIATANCFLTGTRLATPEGPRPIEDLAEGDRVLDADGHAHPVLWVARQTVRAVPWLPDKLSPVRIAAGAFGVGRPGRDLLLSADHALFLGGLLVNAGALVDGDRVTFEPLSAMPPRFTYWHVETHDHVALLAEGLPAESFIDYADRAAFDNHDAYLVRHGADRIIPEMPVPRISSRRHLPPSLRAALADPAARVA